jgi:hypothetical protein
MTEPAPSALIMEKLSQGSLPVGDPLKFWTSYGTGLTCNGCDEVISASVQEQEVEMPNGRMLQFHVQCHALWRTLKDTRPQP